MKVEIRRRVFKNVVTKTGLERVLKEIVEPATLIQAGEKTSLIELRNGDRIRRKNKDIIRE